MQGGAIASTVECVIVHTAYAHEAKLRDKGPILQFHVFVHAFMP